MCCVCRWYPSQADKGAFTFSTGVTDPSTCSIETDGAPPRYVCVFMYCWWGGCGLRWGLMGGRRELCEPCPATVMARRSALHQQET